MQQLVQEPKWDRETEEMTLGLRIRSLLYCIPRHVSFSDKLVHVLPAYR